MKRFAENLRQSAVAFGVLAAIVTGCSLDTLRSSALPEKMPDDVVFTYNEDGGMLPAWTRYEIRNDELVVEKKLPKEDEPWHRFTILSYEEQSSLYNVFRENKFDLIENYEPEEITYDAGGDSMSIRVGTQSHRASSGDNSPISGDGGKRYSRVAKTFHALVKRKERDLKYFPLNLALLGIDRKQFPEIPQKSRSSRITYSDAVKAVGILKSQLRKEERNDVLEKFDDSFFQLVAFKLDNRIEVFVTGVPGGRRPPQFRRQRHPEPVAPETVLTAFVDPASESVRSLSVK